VHQWGLHARDNEVIEDLVNPFPDLYTCGEAFSDYQGWVEGALRSADLVLKRGFDLEPIAAVYQHDHDITPSLAMKAQHAARSAEAIRKYIDPAFEAELLATERKPSPSHMVSYDYFDVN